MAIALTEQYREVSSSGNRLTVGYKLVLTGAYPVSGGNVINNTSLGKQVFTKINSASFRFFQWDTATGYIGKFDVPNNTNPANPSIAFRVYDEATGGIGANEIGGGDTYNASWYIEIQGVPKGGIDGPQI
jgi:hypothetical protein